MTGDLLTEASEEPVASCDAAFSCLLRLGGQTGANGLGAVRCRNVVNGETLSIALLIELAGDLGLEAEHARLDWQRLQILGFSRPLLALLKNTNVIMLTGGGPGVGSEVSVWDPLNPFEEILRVPREDFENAWTGHVLIITTPASNGAGGLPSSDLCWLTSAGLELLGKTSARGQNSKLLDQRRRDPGIRLEPTARRMSRRTNRPPATHGTLSIAHAQRANGRLPRDPVADAQSPPPVLPLAAAEARPLRLMRFCIAAGVILVAAGIGAFLLRGSAADPVATAIALAKEVWAVAPNTQAVNINRRIASIPRTSSEPIPAAPPTTPPVPSAGEPEVAAPSPKPTRTVAESNMPDLAAAPTAPYAAPSVAAPTPKATPLPVDPTTQDLAAAPSLSPDAPEVAAPSAKPTRTVVESNIPGLAAGPPSTPDAFDLAAPHTELGLGTPVLAPDPKTAVSPSTAGLRPSAENTGTLLARGDSLLSVGDVASARLFYERAVDEGAGLAAIRLGETFDPLFLDRPHLRGVRSDPDAALFWYRRARDLGVTGATALLEALEAK